MKKFVTGLLVSTIIISGASGLAISKSYYSSSQAVDSKLVNDDSVAEVNTKPISLNSYKTFFVCSALSYEANTGNEIWDQTNDGKSAVDSAEDDSMNWIIENQIEILKAAEMGITLTNKQKLDVEKTSEETYKSFVTYQKDKLTAILKKVNLKESDFYNEFKKFFQEDQIRLNLKCAILKEYKTPFARVEHILITVKDKTNFSNGKHTDAEAKKIATQILYKVKVGQNFEALAKKYSEDASASNGGDLGYIEKGDMDTAFTNAAYALKPGQISGLIKTKYGYHIMKLISNGAIDTNKLSEEQKKQIIKSLGFSKYFQSQCSKWEKEANIKIIKKSIEFADTAKE